MATLISHLEKCKTIWPLRSEVIDNFNGGLTILPFKKSDMGDSCYFNRNLDGNSPLTGLGKWMVEDFKLQFSSIIKIV